MSQKGTPVWQTQGLNFLSLCQKNKNVFLQQTLMAVLLCSKNHWTPSNQAGLQSWSCKSHLTRSSFQWQELFSFQSVLESQANNSINLKKRISTIHTPRITNLHRNRKDVKSGVHRDKWLPGPTHFKGMRWLYKTDMEFPCVFFPLAMAMNWTKL